MDDTICRLDHAAGRTRPCPEDRCAFWGDGACVVAPLCADFGGNPALVGLLTNLRATLESEDPRSGIRSFHPPGLA